MHMRVKQWDSCVPGALGWEGWGQVKEKENQRSNTFVGPCSLAEAAGESGLAPGHLFCRLSGGGERVLELRWGT